MHCHSTAILGSMIWHHFRTSQPNNMQAQVSTCKSSSPAVNHQTCCYHTPAAFLQTQQMQTFDSRANQYRSHQWATQLVTLLQTLQIHQEKQQGIGSTRLTSGAEACKGPHGGPGRSVSRLLTSCLGEARVRQVARPRLHVQPPKGSPGMGGLRV